MNATDTIVKAAPTQLFIGGEWRDSSDGGILDAIAGAGVPTGPTTWDGYAAAVVASTALEALRTGAKTSVKLADKPDLYIR